MTAAAQAALGWFLGPNRWGFVSGAPWPHAGWTGGCPGGTKEARAPRLVTGGRTPMFKGGIELEPHNQVLVEACLPHELVAWMDAHGRTPFIEPAPKARSNQLW